MNAPLDQAALARDTSFSVDGNRLTLLESGPERLDTLLDLIGDARRSLRILYYIYAADEAGARINAALIAAVKRGVDVSVIIDGFGSDDADATFFEPLEQAGATVCRFSPNFSRRYLLRNHQKLALADGESADARIIIGGFNVEEDYFSESGEASWRDLGLLVEGPAAQRMAGYFDALHDWIRGTEVKVKSLNRALSQWSESAGRLRWLIGGPTRKLSPWARTLRKDMRGGRQIDIIAAYFAPIPSILRRLDKAAKLKGVVRVVTAAKSDNNVTIAAARFTYAGLLRKGVRIYEYQPSKLHTKLYVIDHVVFVGSANFDVRSLFINLELMLRIDDAAFAAKVRGYVDGEIERSRAITQELYREKTGIIQRTKQFFAYIMIAVVDPSLSRGLNFGIDD